MRGNQRESGDPGLIFLEVAIERVTCAGHYECDAALAVLAWGWRHA